MGMKAEKARTTCAISGRACIRGRPAAKSFQPPVSKPINVFTKRGRARSGRGMPTYDVLQSKLHTQAPPKQSAAVVRMRAPPIAEFIGNRKNRLTRSISFSVECATRTSDTVAGAEYFGHAPCRRGRRRVLKLQGARFFTSVARPYKGHRKTRSKPRCECCTQASEALARHVCQQLGAAASPRVRAIADHCCTNDKIGRVKGWKRRALVS